MNAWVCHVVLWAQRDVFRDMGSGFRDKRETLTGMDMLLYLLLVAVLFAIIGLIAWIVGRQDQHQLFNSPRAMFRTLCRAHGLDRSARRLLRSVAAAQRLKQPAEIFLAPHCLAAAQQDPAFREHGTQLARLAAKLYAAQAVEANPPAGPESGDAIIPPLAALLQSGPPPLATGLGAAGTPALPGSSAPTT